MKSIEDLSTIFKELAVLVIDQGTILDRIDFNMEQVRHLLRSDHSTVRSILFVGFEREPAQVHTPRILEDIITDDSTISYLVECRGQRTL